MKKNNLLLITMLITLSGCAGSSTSINTESASHTITPVTILAPEGTPSLALANFYKDSTDYYTTFDIKAGSDPLVAAFTSKSYDVIVAPTNLGAKMYNNTQDYCLYQTIVWGNLYLASKTEITSFSDLSGKSITYFGGTSATPYIVLQSLLTSNHVENVTLTSVDDVATANTMLMSNNADIIVSAQPSLTKIKATAEAKGITIHTLDLQTEWGKLTGSSSYPQASIFFKKSLKGTIDDALLALTDSVNRTIANPEKSSENAVEMYQAFANLGTDVLKTAIPHAHYGVDANQKSAIEFYFNKMNELGLGKAYGEKLPDEGFYYNI